MTSEYIQLLNNLETLKLTEIKNRIDEVTGLVSSNNISFTEGLLKLTNMEIDHRWLFHPYNPIDTPLSATCTHIDTTI